MLVFVDESGDTGTKIEGGSSEVFIVTLVVFEENEEAEAVDCRIKLLKEELKLQEDFEFHFSHTHPKYKKHFFEAVSGHNFFYFGIVIQKKDLVGEEFKTKDSFYKYVCGLVFQNAKPYLNNARVVLDKREGKKFNKAFGTYLKRMINVEPDTKHIKRVKAENSKNNNLIQLADMVCGAIKCCYKKPSKRMWDYRKMISHREIYVQVWPRK